jgi:LysR family transcriptional regulator, glycine cleavage system transcriptional activator
VTGEAEGMRLRLGVLPLYASRQLMPRLPGLRTRYPSLHVDLDTGSNAVTRLGEGLDAAITLMREVEAPLYGRKLTSNAIAVIAGGSLAEGPDAIRTPEDLARTTVMVHRDMPDNFEIWRAGMGLDRLKPAAVTIYDSGQLVLEAAAQGLGVAFMLDVNFDGAADPRLVRLFADRPVDASFSYWFVCRRTALERRAVRLFHDWLIDGQE